MSGIGLALGGGGVRSCIYIGLYEVLKQNKVPITHVSGTSMGAIIGAAIALGMSPDQMKDFVLKLKDIDFLSWKNFNFFNESLVKRDQITKLLNILFDKATFNDTKIPFACTAVDLESKNEVIIKDGSIARAVEASSSYPIIFPPIFYMEKYLVDGGILDAVPVKLVKDLGAQKVLAINIKNNIVRQYISGQVYLKYYKKKQQLSFSEKMKNLLSTKKNDVKLLLDIALESVVISSEHNLDNYLKETKPDLLLEPMVDVSLLDFSKIDEVISLGRKIAQDSLSEIMALLNK